MRCPNVELGHGGGSCFDLLRAKFGLEDAPLRHVAAILRAVDGGNAALWRGRRQLAELDVRMLRDVGLMRADVRRECAEPFWRS